MSVSNDHVDCQEQINAGSDCQLFPATASPPELCSAVVADRLGLLATRYAVAHNQSQHYLQLFLLHRSTGRTSHDGVSHQLTVGDMAVGEFERKKQEK